MEFQLLSQDGWTSDGARIRGKLCTGKMTLSPIESGAPNRQATTDKAGNLGQGQLVENF